MQIASGAELRVTGPAGAGCAVVCVNGGQGHEVEGTWSATLEWLVHRLAPQFPGARVRRGPLPHQVVAAARSCIEDAQAAIAALGAPRTLLLGFSMGGAVASQVAGEPTVETVLGLAPWFPTGSRSSRCGQRLRVLHGSLDRWLPGVPASRPPRRGAASSVRGRWASGRVHAHPRRGARSRPTSALGPAAAVAPRRDLGATRRPGARALSGRRLNPAPFELGRVGHLHVPDEAQPLERPDHPPRDVDLAAV